QGADCADHCRIRRPFSWEAKKSGLTPMEIMYKSLSTRDRNEEILATTYGKCLDICGYESVVGGYFAEHHVLLYGYGSRRHDGHGFLFYRFSVFDTFQLNCSLLKFESSFLL